MWDEMLEHILTCIKEYKKDLNINKSDIEFIMDLYFEYGEGTCGRPKELSQDLKDEFYKFRVRCCNCGKEITLGQYFKENQDYEGIDVYDLPLGGINITCQCGNEIISDNYR